jgi:GT2 family glycosyltransferase
MDVSVIIVNYNTAELTINCINSIFERTKGVDFEVIVVDNKSTDSSVDLLKRDNRIILVCSDENIGFGRGNNLGYRYATGKYVFLLNSDTLLLNDALTIFYHKMESMDKKVCCLGTILYQDLGANQTGHSYAKFMSITALVLLQFFVKFVVLLYPTYRRRYLDYKIADETCVKVDRIIGADMFMRDSVIKECGLFDPDFFMYYEETEMQYRYTKKGFYIYIYKEPLIAHLEGCSAAKETKKANVWQFEQLLRSQILYVKKTQSRYKYLLYKFSLLFIVPCFLFCNPHFVWEQKKHTLKEFYKYLKL